MRIISGIHGGRRIQPPAKMPFTRPTTDIAKEGLFNILNNMIDFEGITTLDLFGGTGAISYELASRGASDLTIIEKDPKMYAFIQKNLADLQIQNAKLFKMDVFKFLESCSNQYDFIFAGPPYALGSIDDLPKIVHQQNLLAEGGIFVLEHTPRNGYESYPLFNKVKNYGTTLFSFFIQD